MFKNKFTVQSIEELKKNWEIYWIAKYRWKETNKLKQKKISGHEIQKITTNVMEHILLNEIVEKN